MKTSKRYLVMSLATVILGLSFAASPGGAEDAASAKPKTVSKSGIPYLQDNTRLFDEAERATLALTYEMTRNITVADATMKRVRAILPDQQVVELAGTIAGYNMVSRFVVAIGIEMK